MKTLRTMHRAIASAAALLGALAFLSACSSLGSVDTLSLLNIAAKSGEAVAKSFEDITPEQEYYVGRAVGANILTPSTLHSPIPGPTPTSTCWARAWPWSPTGRKPSADTTS